MSKNNSFILNKEKHYNYIAAFLILIGAIIRFTYLFDIAYRGDEAIAALLAYDFLEEGKIPLKGLMSSIGAYNPPMLIYFSAIIMVVSYNPLFASTAVILLNLLAIYLSYRFIKKYYSALAAVIATALYSTCVWAVWHSRML